MVKITIKFKKTLLIVKNIEKLQLNYYNLFMIFGNYVKSSKGYKYYSPSKLCDISGNLNITKFINLLNWANLKLGQLIALTDYTDLIIHRYVIKESLLSSQIEGTGSTLADVYANNPTEDIREVNNYFSALNFGLFNIQNAGLPISGRLLKECHKILMKDVRGGETFKQSGSFRTSQNWIGGSSPSDCIFTPPPPDLIADLIDDLEQFIHFDNTLPDLVKVALIHYQFETIHPFLDGNGRIGRLLIILYLIDKKVLSKPVLYLSLYLKTKKYEYYDLLMNIRNNDDYERFIEFFLNGIIATSDQILKTSKKIIMLESKMVKKFSLPNENKLLKQLFINPITTIKDVQLKINVTNKTAFNLINKFVKFGVLEKMDKKVRGAKYSFKELLKLLDSEL